MDEIIKLFINGKELEFDTDPKVVFTYQVTDVTNPTAVKNSFTKSVQVPGTPNNNDIFGHYWDIERYLNGSGEGGAYYNSSKKAPFQLFKGSTLYEEGYAKLDNIKRTGEQITYSLTLYGGLGDFFFQLSTNDDGNQKKLSDLDYTGSGVTEFDFTANIDTVKEAWDALKDNTSGKWQYINFMPAYNGTPSDFDCGKIIIDTSGTSIPTGAKDANAEEETWYYVKNNRWTIGTLPEEMTEWEVHDLRSYLQRPCIRMKEIVNACCNPNNNGGYTVNLDPDFFNNDNPYWTDTWLTLPQVCNLEYNNSQQVLEGASLVFEPTSGSVTGLMYQDMHFDLGDFASNVDSIHISTKIYNSNLRSNTSYVWFWNYNGNQYHSGWWCLGSLFVQLIAVNGDTVVGASQAYNLTTPVRHNGNVWFGHNGHYPESSGYDSSTGTRKMENGSKYYSYMDMPIYNVLGRFGTSNEFVKETSPGVFDSNAYVFNFDIYNLAGSFTGLKMVFYWGATADKIRHYGTTTLFDRTYSDGWVTHEVAAQTNSGPNENHMVTASTTHNLYAVVGESMGRTGTRVNKQLLLNTESSPCDYLLSYAKMYGLHFTKELGEKTINIMTRKTFYKGDDIVDLEELIDRSKEISIKPLMFESKWYQFVQEKDESEMQKKYLTAKGVEYGCKVLDTGYEFNSDKKDLLEDNCIRSGIEVLEKSKWFISYNNDSVLRPWMKLGLRYKLWHGTDEMEHIPTSWGDSGSILPINEGQGLKYYDVFPKLQFHGDGGDPTDGRDCLVFFSGFKNVGGGRTNPLSYILSDDNVWQTELNEGTPCYLFTNYEYIGDKRCCYKLQQLPVFERYLTSDNSGSIAKSLDFGSAQELFIPNYSLTDDTNIYHSFWRTYLTDLFDVNTKQMTCNVRIKDRPGVDWLRRFYWFDNAIWRVNKISDWNATSYDTTKVEFIKVQDIANYTSVTQQKPSGIQLRASSYEIEPGGATIWLYIEGVEAGAGWKITKSGDANVSLTLTAGTGSATSSRATFTANAGNTLLNEYFTVTRDDNAASATIHVIQHYTGENNLSVSPSRILLPRSGSTVDFTFTWFNQGGNYVTGATTSGTINVSSIDTATNRLANKASATFGAQTASATTHGTVTFTSGSGQAVVYADQFIGDYNFKGSGETKQLGTQYATGATVVEAPYWLTLTDTGDGDFDMTAELNPTTTGRTGWVTMELNGIQSGFHVSQRGADEFYVERLDGSGNVLAASGTTQMRVSSTSAWTGTSDVSWAVLGSSGSSTSQTFNVVFGENTGETREAIFTFTNEDGTVVTFKQTQSGIDGENELVYPNVLIFPSSGGTGVITVNIPNEWRIVAYSAWISTDISSATTCSTVNATVLGYSGEEERTGTIIFYDTVTSKSYIVTVIQQVGTGEVLEVNPTTLTFPASGGTLLVSIISNTSWTIS